MARIEISFRRFLSSAKIETVSSSFAFPHKSKIPPEERRERFLNIHNILTYSDPSVLVVFVVVLFLNLRNIKGRERENSRRGESNVNTIIGQLSDMSDATCELCYKYHRKCNKQIPCDQCTKRGIQCMLRQPKRITERIEKKRKNGYHLAKEKDASRKFWMRCPSVRR